MKSQNKTTATNASVEKFVDGVDDEAMRRDSLKLIELMKNITGQQPKMWGPSIIGFDSYHYKYESGREGDMCVIGFSPRKTELSIYVTNGLSNYEAELKKLGKHKAAKSCLYIKKLSDIDTEVLESILRNSYKYVKARDGKMHRAE